MAEGFALGQQLRKEYGPHFYSARSGSPSAADGSGLSADAVKVWSTDVDRTVDTAHAVLLGLLSPADTAVAEATQCGCRSGHGKRSPPACIAECLGLPATPDLPAVVVRPNAEDPAMQQAGVCEGWDAWRLKMEAGRPWRAQAAGALAEAAELVQELVGEEVVRALRWPGEQCAGCVNVTAPDFNYLSFMETVWSNLVCYEAAGEPYMVRSGASHSTGAMMRLLQPVADYVWKRRYVTSHGPLTGGILLYEWIATLTAAARPPGSGAGRRMQAAEHHARAGPRMAIYSAHDTTVFSLLAALGAAEAEPVPHFVSHVVMELWQHQGSAGERGEDFAVRVLYDGHLVKTALGCPGGACSLGEFVAGTKDRALPPSACKPKQKQLDDTDLSCCNTP